MDTGPQQIFAKEQKTEERRLEKEGKHALHGQCLAENAPPAARENFAQFAPN